MWCQEGYKVQTVQDFAKTQNISKAIVDTWIYRHSLPIIQIGRRIYIDQDEFKEWLTSHKKVVSKEPPSKTTEVVVPPKCRQSSIASKMSRIY